jgi:hypothetical protein
MPRTLIFVTSPVATTCALKLKAAEFCRSKIWEGKMLFKLCYSVRRLNMHPRNLLELHLNDDDDVRLVLRAPTDEEIKLGRKGYASLDVFCEQQIPKRAQPVFAALLEGRRPAEGQKAKSADEMIHHKGPCYGLDLYPDPFISLIDQVKQKFSSASNTIVSLLRWRYAQEGPPSPITHRGLQGLLCSDDAGISWHSIPGRYSFCNVTPPRSFLKIREVDISELSEFAKKNLQEPVYHELLREAKELQFGSPRSSVLIAVSALEVAVKSTASAKAPEAEWIINSIQSPPVVDMLIQYFPKLFQNKRLFYEPTKKDGIIKTIYDAVHIRNQMVHKGASPPQTEKIEEILAAVQKLIWICDYYSGHEWAESHIDAL